MKQKIVIVSHCFLNDAAKLRNQDAADMEQESLFSDKTDTSDHLQ